MTTVHMVPILRDNYAYVLVGKDGTCGIVDPGEAGPIIQFLEAQNLKPDIILITHHHWDHMDGVPDMLAWHDCPLVGADRNGSRPNSPAKSRVDVPFERILNEQSDFEFGGERVRVLETPGHTPEHICFYFEESGFVLAGDTLFSMGCGRILDGTAEELWNSLQKLSALPDETLIYCGHEYTIANGKFCQGIEPNNQALQARMDEVRDQRRAKQPTIPVSLKMEKETNAFLRAGSAERFAELRLLKDKG